ncbi:MAG: oligosaccharide flippase family protein [Pseudomonadota bacterium]
MIDRKFKTDTMFMYGSQLGSMGSSFLFSLLVTRYAGVEVFGELTLLIALAGFLSNLLTFRTNEAVIAFYKRGEVNGDHGLCKLSLFAGVALDTLVGLLLMLILAIFADVVAGELLHNPETVGAIKLYALMVLVQLVTSTPVAYLMAKGRFKLVWTMSLAANGGKLAVAGLFILAGSAMSLESSVMSMLFPAAVIYLSAYGYLLWLALVGLRKVRVCRSGGMIREYISFSVSTFMSSTLKAGNQNIDSLVLGYLAGTHTVGLYGLFRQFLGALPFLSSPFTALVYPKFVEAVAGHKISLVRKSIGLVNRRLIVAYVIVSMLIIVCLTAYLWWIREGLHLGEKVSFLLLLTAAIVNGLLWWSRPFSNSVNPDISLRANLYASGFLLISLYPSIQFSGMMGAASCMLLLALMLYVYWTKVMRNYV